MDKELEKVFSKLQKDYGAALPDVRVAGIVKRLVLSSPQLNYAFGGGFPIGRVVELFGPESGGKTTIASFIGGQFQRRTDGGAKAVLFLDIEHSFDKLYAETAGLNTSDDFIFARPVNGEEAFTITEEFVKSGKVGLIIWDSVATTSSVQEMDNEYGKSNFGKSAALMSQGLRKLNPYLSRTETSMILINQIRADPTGFSPAGPAECVGPDTLVDICF